MASQDTINPGSGNPVLTCYECNVTSHFKCLPVDVANPIPSLKPDKPIKWKCNRCVECTVCHTRTAGKNRNHKWARDFLLCSECFRKREKKEFCPICKQFWSYKGREAEEYSMIECTACKMWIHRICDYHLTEEVFDNFEAGIYTEYICMLCRQEKRKVYISKPLNIAEKEDKLGWFKEPVEMEEYKRIIKNPMDFSKMRQNMDKYVVDINLLKDHFNLIFTNAFNYNKPTEKPYKAAERVQEAVNKVLERKWDKLIEKQDMSIEEQEHQKWVQEQIRQDPDFLDKSEDVVVPPKRFHYVPHKVKQDNEEMTAFMNEPERGQSVEPSVQESDNDSSVLSSKLRKRKRNLKYKEDDENYPGYGDATPSIKGLTVEPKPINKKGSQSSKNRKNPEVHFSSDEEIENIKNLTLKDIDFSNPKNFTAKHLLEAPEELEDKDIKQYYHNPVRCCFDDPMLAFVPICFLCGSFGNEQEFVFCNLCGESFHPYCEKFKEEDRDKLQEYWKCLNCKYCEVCNSADREKMLLYCDVCDRAYHTNCLKPKLAVVPSCGWKCHDCFKCTKCGTTSFFKNREDYFASKKIDYSISKDFSLCIECAIEEYHKTSNEQKCEK